MSSSYKDVQVSGNTKTTTTYTGEKNTSMEYKIMGDGIKNEFNFLVNEMPDKLDSVLEKINNIASNDSALYFENGSTVSNLEIMAQELQQDINQLKSGLSTLHDAIIKDIDNVNGELGVNFGHWAFYKVNEVDKLVEEVTE